MTSHRYRYIIAIIYAVVLFLDRLDLTIVNIILPTLARNFHVPIMETEWINNAYLLALAISIPISGWLGLRFGVKKVFMMATAVFGLSSLCCALSPTIEWMILFRFFQGLGGGVIIPVGMTMVYQVFDSSEYASITSYIFMPTLIAPAISPGLGGVISHFFSWQWVFLFAVPFCLVAVLLCFIVLKEQEVNRQTPLDWLGFLLSSCALICILFFISMLGKNASYWQISSIGILAIGSIILFLKQEQRQTHPLIDLKFFKNKLFLQANLIQLAFQISHFGSIFLIAMYFQVGVGMSAMVAGLIMGMQALGAICTSRLSVRLFNRFGPGLPIMLGFMGVGLVTPCILLINQPNLIFAGCAILFCRGLASGLCGTPIQTMSILGFNKKDIGHVNALFNANRQIAISLGIALTSLLISYGFKSYGIEGSMVTHSSRGVFYDAFILISVMCLIGVGITRRVHNDKVLNLIHRSL